MAVVSAPSPDRSLIGDLLHSSALLPVLGIAALLGRNILVLAGLAAMSVGAWTASPVAGWLVTGAALLILDFKFRG